MSTATASKKMKLDPAFELVQQAFKEGRCKLEELSLKALKPDPKYQARALHLDMNHVHRLDQDFRVMGSLFPVTVYRVLQGKKELLLLVDGFHRHEVYTRAGLKSIKANVINGTEADAVAFAAMANQQTMLPRKQEDIRKACEMLFALPEWWEKSDTFIAAHVGAKQPTVGSYRRDYNIKTGTPIPSVVRDSRGIGYPYQQKKGATRTISPNPANPRRFRAHVGTRVVLGDTEQEVQDKVEKLTGLAMCASPSELKTLLLRRGLFFEAVGAHPKTDVIALRAPGVILVTAKFHESPSVPEAVGRVLMARHAHGKPTDRAVVVGYKANCPAPLVEIAESMDMGIEFLTPDEFIASLKTSNEGGPN